MPRRPLTELIDLSHRREVAVSTGGFIERVLTQGSEAVNRYIRECRDLGFDIIEISSGFITRPADDWLRLVERVQQAGLKAKPEVGIQSSAPAAPRARRSSSRRARVTPIGRSSWRGGSSMRAPI
jgi:phosphosulfolactate synthase (CoM biosynthesis protein A)